MGGGPSTEAIPTMAPGWNPKTEDWYTSISRSYENSTSIGDALTSCYSLLEASWSTRSENYKFLSESKLRHALSSCKSFLNLAISKELHKQESEAAYWYNVNLLSSALSTILFIAITYLIARLRRSNSLRGRMKRYMPEKWFDRADKTKSWFRRSPKPANSTAAFSPSVPIQLAPD